MIGKKLGIMKLKELWMMSKQIHMKLGEKNFGRTLLQITKKEEFPSAYRVKIIPFQTKVKICQREILEVTIFRLRKWEPRLCKEGLLRG